MVKRFRNKRLRTERSLPYVYVLSVVTAFCVVSQILTPSSPALPLEQWERPPGLPPLQRVAGSGAARGPRLPLLHRVSGNGLPHLHHHARSEPQDTVTGTGLERRDDQAVIATEHAEDDDSPPSLRFSFSDALLREPEVCIIPNVCISYNFTAKHTYVPESYRAHAKLLQRCFRPRVQFYDPEDPPAELRDAINERKDVDIIGEPLNSHVYNHFAHFIMEFFRHLAVPLALFLHPAELRGSWMCQASTPGVLVRCKNPGAVWLLKPRIVLSDAMLGGKKHWNRGFLAMLMGGSKAHPHHVLVVPDKQPMHCFRSLLTSNKEPDTSNAKRDVLFREIGIKRDQVATCTPHIVVIVRDPKFRIDRTISEHSMHRLERLLLQRIPSASVEVLQGLSGLSVRKQARLMQRTDILVTVHGAELSNLVFLRRGVSVLEIYPFGYENHWFLSLFKSAGATHVKVGSKPDKDRFFDCVERHGLSREVQARFKNKFLQQMDVYKRTATDDEREHAGFFNDRHGMWQLCARSQRIFINPAKIADLVVTEARKMCSGS